MFVLNGLPPKLMVVNIKTKAVEVQHDLPAPSLTDRGTVHAQFRRARYTAQGTYLIPYLEMGQVVEYLGPATAVQILDDPGIPEKPGESQH